MVNLSVNRLDSEVKSSTSCCPSTSWTYIVASSNTAIVITICMSAPNPVYVSWGSCDSQYIDC